MTIAAGMPVLANLPDMSRPGDHGALDRVEQVEAVGEVAEAVPLGVRLRASSRRSCRSLGSELSGPHTLNHQSLPNSPSTFRIAPEVERLGDALLDQRAPPGASIIAAETSHDAMIAYCGLVELYIR